MTRRDLLPAQQAVQASHAAIEISRTSPRLFHPQPNLIVCVVDDEAALYQLASRLSQSQIPYTLWREPDWNNELTSLATLPLADKQRRLLRGLTLLGREKPALVG